MKNRHTKLQARYAMGFAVALAVFFFIALGGIWSGLSGTRFEICGIDYNGKAERFCITEISVTRGP